MEELHEYATDLKFLLSQNAPKRDDNSYSHVIKHKGVIVSPFPGNLKQNGTQLVEQSDAVVVKHGYEPAMYALYANKKSRKPQYIEKSIQQFTALMEGKGWEQE